MIRNLQALARSLFSRATPGQSPEAADDGVEEKFQQALSHHQRGQLAEAERLYGTVLAMQEDHFPALNFLGLIAYQSQRPQQAVDLISRAIAIEPGQAGMHSNLALALNAVGRGREAVEACERALRLDARCVEAYSNRGNSLWGLGRREEALASYAAALAIQPDHAQTHWNEGYLRMQIGQLGQGWKKQEWRWQLEHMNADRRDFAQPLWLGKEDLKGKTILLHAEQGFGDTIQFCRYAKLVSALGARVILEVQKPLKSLLANLEGVALLLARGEALPAFDYHCPLLSLPLAFNTTLATIPAERRYLSCDPAVAARWRDRLGPKSAFRVGLAWVGSNRGRQSIPLCDALGILTQDMQFVSLQKDLSAADRRLLEKAGNVVVVADELADFSDTAAVVELMDLVVTIDTSVAHLAAAMGKPVWIPLDTNPDWRWFLDRDDSPWYPGVRLFRQSAAGDWTSVIARIRDELQKLR